MHPIRKQRLQIVLLIILAAACASGLVIYMLGQNTNYFYTPSQIQSGEAPQGVFVRAGGMVVDGSVERDLDSLDVAFKVTDGGAAVLVKYSGILPDLFAEGEAAVAAGRIGDDGSGNRVRSVSAHQGRYHLPSLNPERRGVHIQVGASWDPKTSNS